MDEETQGVRFPSVDDIDLEAVRAQFAPLPSVSDIDLTAVSALFALQSQRITDAMIEMGHSLATLLPSLEEFNHEFYQHKNKRRALPLERGRRERQLKDGLR